MENTISILNPDVKEVQVGIRNLRTIKIYPMSVIDQFKTTELFQEAIGAFIMNKAEKDLAFIALFITILKTNIPKVLALVVDPSEDIDVLMGEITNNQLSVIAETIYEVNYAVISKNVASLLKKLPTPMGSPSVRQSSQSVESMDTESKIVSESLGRTED